MPDDLAAALLAHGIEPITASGKLWPARAPREAKPAAFLYGSGTMPPPKPAASKRRKGEQPLALQPAASLYDGADIPRALVLIVLITECECGTTYVAPNESVAVRYKTAINGHHLSRKAAGADAALPRERKEVRRTCPFCPACFGA